MTSPFAGQPEPVFSVPVGLAHTHPTGPIVLRVKEPAEVSKLDGVALDRVVWLEVPLRLAEQLWPAGAPLDVVLEDPEGEAAGLYTLSRIRYDHPIRVTIPGLPGMARAARIAMALGLPVRLMTQQPSPQVLAGLDEVLNIYLHDSQTSAPVEFLQAALAWWLHGDAPPPWVALEIDPDWYPRAGDNSFPPVGAWPPQEREFVSRWIARLVEAGAECAACHFRDWCQGFFKWPDTSYSCDGVKRLLVHLEESAAQIARDLEEAQEL
jgi:hypothetical protein